MPPTVYQQIADFLRDADKTSSFKRKVNENIVTMIEDGLVTYTKSDDGYKVRLTEKGKASFIRSTQIHH